MTVLELRLDEVVKTYAPQVTIGPISFTIEPGECVSLLGPSGCGKSTTLRCIAGFEKLSSGAIWLGQSRLDLVPAHKRNVGLVFQNYALFPHLDVFENVAFGLRLSGVDKKSIPRRVSDALELVDLPGYSNRRPQELSGGQQQRVAIARAIVTDPGIMLFDEPLSSLDLKLRIQMRSELRSLQKKFAKTTIYVTHDQTEALALSDRIVVLSQGRIEQFGTPREVYERPASQFVAKFLGSANLITAKVVMQSASGPAVVEVGQDLRFHVAAGDFSRREVMLMIRPECVQVFAEASTLGSANHVEARIVDSTYLGDTLSLLLCLGQDLTLSASVKASVKTKAFVPDQTVTVHIPTEDIYVL